MFIISLHLLLVIAEYCKAEGKQLSRAEIVSVFTAYFKLDRALEALANLLPLREKGGKSLNGKLHNTRTVQVIKHLYLSIHN